MTQKYENLARERDRICAKRRLLQAQIDVLDELIGEIHDEMEIELDSELHDLDIDEKQIKDGYIEEEK